MLLKQAWLQRLPLTADMAALWSPRVAWRETMRGPGSPTRVAEDELVKPQRVQVASWANSLRGDDAPRRGRAAAREPRESGTSLHLVDTVAKQSWTRTLRREQASKRRTPSRRRRKPPPTAEDVLRRAYARPDRAPPADRAPRPEPAESPAASARPSSRSSQRSADGPLRASPPPPAAAPAADRLRALEAEDDARRYGEHTFASDYYDAASSRASASIASLARPAPRAEPSSRPASAQSSRGAQSRPASAQSSRGAQSRPSSAQSRGSARSGDGRRTRDAATAPAPTADAATSTDPPAAPPPAPERRGLFFSHPEDLPPAPAARNPPPAAGYRVDGGRWYRADDARYRPLDGRGRAAAAYAGDAYAAACRARAAYFEIEQYGAFTRAVARLTDRATETLQRDARCAQYRDATLYTHRTLLSRPRPRG